MAIGIVVEEISWFCHVILQDHMITPQVTLLPSFKKTGIIGSRDNSMFRSLLRLFPIQSMLVAIVIVVVEV